MPHVLLVNPAERPKKGKKIMAKTKRSPAQRAATRKMIAANKARARSAKAPARKTKHRAKRKTSTVVTRHSNPSTRRKYKRTGVAEASYAGRRLRYRRKNPVGGFFTETMIPAAIGGAGALTLDVLWAVAPIPATLRANQLAAPVIKLAGAIGLGMLAGMVTSKRAAQQIAAGAVTVTLYNAAKQGLAKVSGGKIPGMGEYVGEVYVDPVAVGEYVGEYVEGDGGAAQIGYPSAGMIVGDLQPDGSVEGYETGVYR